MDFEFSHIIYDQAAYPVKHESGMAAEAGHGQSGSPADETHVSPAVSLAAEWAAAPDVRMEKVEAIRQALAAGTYSVRNCDVAASLVKHLLKQPMLQGRSHTFAQSGGAGNRE